MVRSMLLTLLGGCYLDVSAGASKTAGGVKGYGWEIGMAGGIGWDIGRRVRPSVGVDATQSRVSADDGKFGAEGFGYHARLDLGLTDPQAYDPGKKHLLMSDLSGTQAQTRLTLDYGHGRHQKLQFTAPDDPMTYKDPATTHSFYLGFAREYDWRSRVRASFGVGPHVTYMPNDFVGDATAVGLQAHASYWFIPRTKTRQTGSVWDHYNPSGPIQQGPERNPSPTGCPGGVTSTGDCL